MRSLITAIFLLSACGQPIEPVPSTPIIDAGVTPVGHRIKIGRHVTSDGLDLGVPPIYFDTALNMRCFLALGEDQQQRCFPRIDYNIAAFSDGACATPVAVVRGANQNGNMSGVSGEGDRQWFRIFRVGSPAAGSTYWMRSGAGDCVESTTTDTQMIYAVGEDLTATLEWTILQWRDSP